MRKNRGKIREVDRLRTEVLDRKVQSILAERMARDRLMKRRPQVCGEFQRGVRVSDCRTNGMIDEGIPGGQPAQIDQRRNRELVQWFVQGWQWTEWPLAKQQGALGQERVNDRG